MRSKGYSGYRGRKKGKKVLLAVALLLVVLFAGAFLLIQDYLVYDGNGKMRLDLPFFDRAEEVDGAPLDEGEVNIDIVVQEEESPLREVEELHARMMAGRVLERDVEKTVAATLEDSIVIEVKRVNGSVTYASAASIPEEVEVAGGQTRENLHAAVQSEKYVVARMATLCDSYFVRAYRDAALCRENGGYWYDGDSRTWLDPTHPQTLAYITSLCRDLAQLGVDELMLDYFSYPLSGKTDAIYGLEQVDREEVLADFAAALRANLPEEMVLGIVLRADPSEENGVSAELITENFDRVYLMPTVDAGTVKAMLGSGYGAERYVAVTDRAPASGGYLVG